MEGLPNRYWAKKQPYEDGLCVAWHPLVDHAADVSACMAALLDRSLVSRRLARLAGRSGLDDVARARLLVLAWLHDAGKCHPWFARRAFATEQRHAGHLRPMLALFRGEGISKSQERWRGEALEALDLAVIASWFDATPSRAGSTVDSYLLALLAHHGRMVRPQDCDRHTAAAWLQEPGGLPPPLDGLRELGSEARRCFPEAFTPHADPLPRQPEFQHAWVGLLNWADWMGSDEKRFPYSLKGDGDRYAWSRQRADEVLRERHAVVVPSDLAPDDSLSRILAPSQRPRAVQTAMRDVMSGGSSIGSVLVLEAETGSGKTEAALALFADLLRRGDVEGLYFALPTRTAATQIHRRIFEVVGRLFPDAASRPPVVLAVPGYLRVDDQEGVPLPPFEVQWPERPEDAWRWRAWAGEAPKRYFAGAVIVGTIDQALLSRLRVGHAHLRSTCLLRHLLVVDEVHASDTYMNRLLEAVLRLHLRAGGHALLMSATLGASVRRRLLASDSPQVPEPPKLAEALAVPFPVLTAREGNEERHLAFAPSRPPRSVELELSPCSHDPATIATRALDGLARGAKVLVVRNTVTDCIATQQAVERLAGDRGIAETSLLRCAGVPAPHHGRFASEDRKHLDRAIEAAFGHGSAAVPCLAIATQTVEQSLDLDADLLLTDLCPMDVLLQRLGRLHRHDRTRPPGFQNPRVVVLTPEDRDLGRFIHKDGRAQGGQGLGSVYEDLRVIEATWSILEHRMALDLPANCRWLVESSTHPEGLRQLASERGEPWSRHHSFILGLEFAEGAQGAHAVLPVERPFTEAGPSELEDDERIQTRLGEGDRVVAFSSPAVSAFGSVLTEIRVPAWLARGVGETELVAATAPLDDRGFSFALGAKHFVYDRLGLRSI